MEVWIVLNVVFGSWDCHEGFWIRSFHVISMLMSDGGEKIVVDCTFSGMVEIMSRRKSSVELGERTFIVIGIIVEVLVIVIIE